MLSLTAFYRPKFSPSTSWKRPNSRKSDQNAAIHMLQESVFNSPVGSLVAALSDPRDSWNDPSKMHKQASVESSLFVAPEFLKGIAEASTMSLGARSCAPFMR